MTMKSTVILIYKHRLWFYMPFLAFFKAYIAP